MTPEILRFPLRIDAAHPCLPGHFPGRPVVPGVLILEEVMRCARDALDLPLRLARVPQVKFATPLLPDEDAVIELTLDRPALRARFRLMHDARLLAAGELVFLPA